MGRSGRRGSDRRGSDRNRSGRSRVPFWLGVTAVIIAVIAAVIFAAGYVIRYFRDYFHYASLEGTGVFLEEDGLSGLLEWIGKEYEVPENADVAFFGAELRQTGEVYDFTLSLEEFDEQKEYVRDVRFVYTSSTGSLDQSEEVNTLLAVEYDPNAEVSYLNQCFLKIPFEAQMRALDFDRYTVEFIKDTQLLEGTAVIDGRDGEAFPVLTWEEYRQGTGGGSDGSSQLVISLTDGTGATGQRIVYLCAAADEEALVGSPEAVMQTDYRINGGELSLTDDYGETWVSSGLTETQVQETLDTYQSGQQIPENSFCADGNGRFALFYGASPVLRILENDGEEIRDIPFEENFPRNCIARVVRFLDEENWYAGLGTDWSMGTGGATYVYWTHDGGETWEAHSVGGDDSLILTGLVYTDLTNGMMTKEDPFGNESWPHVYITSDGGESFAEIDFPWDTISDDVTFLNKVDSLTYENGVYTLIMGQGSYGNMKARFTGNSLSGVWTFEESYVGTVHTWG